MTRILCLLAALCGASVAQAQTFPGQLPPNNVLGNPTGVAAPPAAMSPAQIAAALGIGIPLSAYCANLATSGADITSCLQTAIDAAQAKGACLFLPPNSGSVVVWTISSTINIGNGSAGVPSTTNNFCIIGGPGGAAAAIYGGGFGTYLSWTGAAGTMFSINGPVNGIVLRGIQHNGGNVAARLIRFNSVRDVELTDMGGTGCTIACWDFQGLAATGSLNFQITASRNYVTTSVAGAIAVNFDGVLVNSTDTWLSTFTNNRFESLGTNGIALRLGFSDNILWQQLHALATGTGGCALQFDSTTSGSGGNSFPTGHLFVKSAILGAQSTCVKSTAGNSIGVNNFVDYGTTDGELIPTDPRLRGVTDQGVTFGGWGAPPAAVAYTPSYVQNGGTQGTGIVPSGEYVLTGTSNYTVYIRIAVGASGVTAAGFSLSIGLPSTPVFGGACSGINSSSGKALATAVTGGVASVVSRLYDATFPIANNDVLLLTCNYQ